MCFKIVDQSQIFDFDTLKKIDDHFKLYIEKCGCVTLLINASDICYREFKKLVLCRHHSTVAFNYIKKLINSYERPKNYESEAEKHFKRDKNLLIPFCINGPYDITFVHKSNWSFLSNEAFKDHIITIEDTSEMVDHTFP